MKDIQDAFIFTCITWKIKLFKYILEDYIEAAFLVYGNCCSTNFQHDSGLNAGNLEGDYIDFY